MKFDTVKIQSNAHQNTSIMEANHMNPDMGLRCLQYRLTDTGILFYVAKMIHDIFH